MINIKDIKKIDWKEILKSKISLSVISIILIIIVFFYFLLPQIKIFNYYKKQKERTEIQKKKLERYYNQLLSTKNRLHNYQKQLK